MIHPIQLELTEFLDLLTYNKLFNYVDLPSPVAAQLTLCDSEKQICYCELTNDIATSRVWYPIQSWIDECKRRSEIEKTLAYARQNNHTAMSGYFARKLEAEPATLQQQLVQAAVKGDMNEVKRIQELIEKSNV